MWVLKVGLVGVGVQPVPTDAMSKCSNLRRPRAAAYDIRAPHQVPNFVRSCEAVSKQPTVRKISLITSYDDQTNLAELNDKLEELKQSLREMDFVREVKVNQNLHEREIRLDNGWVITLGRGLDIYWLSA